MNYKFKNVSDMGTSNSGGNYGRFGLNEATLTRFEYNGQGGSSSNPNQDVLDVTFRVGEKDFMYRIFPPKAWSTDENSEQYKKELEMSEETTSTAIFQIVQAIVPASTVEQSINTANPASFKDFIQLMERLVKAIPNWNTKPLHLFLHWQATPSEGQQKTYLEVPKVSTLKFGNAVFVVAKQEGEWSEVKDEKGLRYKKGEETHPISRSKWFVESSKNANRIDMSQSSPSDPTSSTFTEETKEDW